MFNIFFNPHIKFHADAQMKKLLFTIWISILCAILVLSANNCIAVGLQYGAEDRTIVFEPNIERGYSFNLVNAARIDAFLTGDFTEYAQLVDSAPKSGPRAVSVLVKLPGSLEPGFYTLYMNAKEIADVTAPVGGVAAVRVRIPILVLHDEAYPVFDLSVKDGNVDEILEMSVGVHNYGREIINAAQASITVFDENNNTLANLTTDIKSVGSNKDETLKAFLDTKSLSLRPNVYRAVARLSYDSKALSDIREKSFMIGSFNVKISSLTSKVYPKTTNKFEIYVYSDWAGSINDVYANVYTPDGEVLKTPNIDLVKPAANMEKASGKLETYWETDDLTLGSYDVDVELFYNKGSLGRQSFKVDVVEMPVDVVIEQPKPFQLAALEGSSIILFNKSVPITIFLMIMLAIIVIINLLLFIKKKPFGQGQHANNSSNSSSSPVQSNSDTGAQSHPSVSNPINISAPSAPAPRTAAPSAPASNASEHSVRSHKSSSEKQSKRP